MKYENQRAYKQRLVDAFGGGCQHCGYARCLRALQFHHIDPSTKYDETTRASVSLKEVESHPERFELLCANCHFAEHEARDEVNALRAICLNCGDEFRTAAHRSGQGRGMYCSRRCADTHRPIAAQKRIAKRFWEKVDRETTPDGCWPWTGYAEDGSGFMSITAPGGSHYVRTAASMSYELNIGPIPEGKQVRASCGTPLCVRPEHLVAVTRSELMADVARMGHTTAGERSGTAKLTDTQVREIRARLAAGDTQAALAREYGVKPMTMSDIDRRKTWKHLD